MADLKGLIRMRGWALEEERRKLAALYELEAGLVGRLNDLSAEIDREKRAAEGGAGGVTADLGGWLAAARGRRDRLNESLEQARAEARLAEEAVAEAFRELKKVELVASARAEQAARKRARNERLRLDEIGLETHRRRSVSEAREGLEADGTSEPAIIADG